MASLVKKIIGVAAAVIIPGASIAGSLYLFNEFKKLKSSCYRIGGFKFVKLTQDEIIISLIIKINNKSDIGITLSGQHYDIFLNENKLATIDITEQTKLLPRALSPLPLTISFNPKTAFKGNALYYLQMATKPAENKLKISGYATVAIWKLKLTKYPMELEYTIKELMEPSDTSYKCPD